MARSTRRGAGARQGGGGGHRARAEGSRAHAHAEREHGQSPGRAPDDAPDRGPDQAHGHEPGHVHAGYDRLGNPQDLAAYLARLEGEDRLAWQKPDEVIRLLGVKRGDRVCDVGVGPGYFALRLARAVGAQGEVYAFDAEPRMLEVLRQRMAQERLFHVHPILAEEGMPPRPCDLVLVVNTFHHFRDGAGYLRRLARHLKPGGRIANIDFHKRDLPVGPPPEHRVAREDFLAVAREAGLRLAAEHEVLPYQYFLVLEPEAVAREASPPAPALEVPAEPVQPAPAAAPTQPAKAGTAKAGLAKAGPAKAGPAKVRPAKVRRPAAGKKAGRPPRRAGASGKRTRQAGRGGAARRAGARRGARR